MLSKSWRIVHQTEIKKTYFTRYKNKTENTQIYLRQNQQIANFHLLVVISKKVFKRANLRNRLRRRIIAIFEILKTENRLPPYIQCIIQVKNKNLIYIKTEDIKTEILTTISELFKKINTFNDTNKK